MKVQNDCYVSINYRLHSDAGELIDESEDGQPFSFVVGYGQLVPGVEQRICGMGVGERAEFVVGPEDGYGPVREELIRDIPRESFPEDFDLQPGMHFRASGPHGPLTLKILSVGDDGVKVDLNHPLAGQNLHFSIEIVAVREATDEDIMGAMVPCGASADGAGCAGCGGGCGGMHS